MLVFEIMAACIRDKDSKTTFFFSNFMESTIFFLIDCGEQNSAKALMASATVFLFCGDLEILLFTGFV